MGHQSAVLIEALVVPFAAVAIVVKRYVSSPARRGLAVRFLRNRHALVAGSMFFVVYAGYAVATGGGLLGFAVALLLSITLAAIWDRVRPAHGDSSASPIAPHD